jgi:hypothetical protein
MNRYSKAISNCPVLSPDDSSHVRVATPFELKRREIQERDLINPDEDQVRARETARRRKSESVRLL